MDRLEKVITGFTCLLSCTTPNDCSECGYECKTAIHVKTPVNMIFDAIDLLKSQEPVVPILDETGMFRCANCKKQPVGYKNWVGEVFRHNLYCPKCGKKVKWE